MDIALSIGRWLLAISMSTALSLWIFMATINATAANRDVVKSWLSDSGVYDTALGSAFRVSSTGSNIVTADILQQAFVQTFPGSYIEQGANTVIDSAYDWLDGTAPAITFSVPVHEKTDEFRANLVGLITPKLAALPECLGRTVGTDPNNITCIPNGVKPGDYASQLTQPSGESNFLSEPITQETFSQIPHMPWLPASVQWLHISVWALPVLIVIFGGLYVAASPDKLRGVSHTGRRLTVGAAITLVGGLFLWYTTTAIDLSASAGTGDAQNTEIIKTLINPLAQTVLPGIGAALSLYSGIVIAIAGPTWLGAFIWRHRRTHDGSKRPLVPPAPKTPQESKLPTPLDRP